MAETNIAVSPGFGREEDLPNTITEGQRLYSTDTAKEFIDHDGVRTRLNPPGDWNETVVDSPDYIANKPNFDDIIHEIDFISERLEKDVAIYGVMWDKTTSQMQRLYDANGVTTDTTNFVHKGSTNSSYTNPFDSIYPWSDCKQCNVNLATYKLLGTNSDIRDAVVAWYGDPDFATDGSNGFVGRYTPEFWYRGYEDLNRKIILVAEKEISGFIHHKASIRSIGFVVDDGNGGLTSNDGIPVTNVSPEDLLFRAKKSGFTIQDIYEYDAQVALYMVEFANTDIQNVIGNGCLVGHQPSSNVVQGDSNSSNAIIPVSQQSDYIEGAILYFNVLSNGNPTSVYRSTKVTSIESFTSDYFRVNFSPSVNLVDECLPFINGKVNADSIGNASGYIGTNGFNNAWYRGSILHANKSQFTLGAYREKNTNHFWLAVPEELNALDTTFDESSYTDTGLQMITTSGVKSVGDYSVPSGMSAYGIVSSNSGITGDSQNIPSLGTQNSKTYLGGDSMEGNRCGVLYGNWTTAYEENGDYFSTCASAVALLKSKPNIIENINIARAHGVHVYGVLWDKKSTSMQRIYDSEDITTVTTNFVHSGTLNSNYDNPFDDIYPWSECKQCNVDLTAYSTLAAGDDITDAVTAWYGDNGFALDGSNGFVGRYTPEFWYYGYESEEGKIVLVSDDVVEGFIRHRPSIRSHGFAVDDGNGGVTSNDGHPLSGISVSTIHSRATSSGFTLLDIYEYDANVALFMVEFASIDAQSKLGSGCSSLYSVPSSKVSAAATGATTVVVPMSLKANCIPGATLNFASTSNGSTPANKRTIVSVEDSDSTHCLITFTPAIDLTTSMYINIIGKNNADSIGNQSGYIGTDGKNNAWYRGAILYGNQNQYTLGAAREKTTAHIWLCPAPKCDDYDALDTSVFSDTGISVYSNNTANWYAVKDYTIPEGNLAAIGPVTSVGSGTTDYQYCIRSSNANSTLTVGGHANNTTRNGVLCATWEATASSSSATLSACLLLRSPR